MCGMDFSWMVPTSGGAGLNRHYFFPTCQNPLRFFHGVQNTWRSPPELMNGEVTNRRERKPQAEEGKEKKQGY